MHLCWLTWKTKLHTEVILSVLKLVKEKKEKKITAHNQEIGTNKIFVLLIDCGKWPSFRAWNYLGNVSMGISPCPKKKTTKIPKNTSSTWENLQKTSAVTFFRLHIGEKMFCIRRISVRKRLLETNSYTTRAHGFLKVTLRPNSIDHVYQDHSLCQSLCKQLWPSIAHRLPVMQSATVLTKPNKQCMTK